MSTSAFNAYYLDGKSAVKKQVSVVIEPEGISFSTAGGSEFWAFSEMDLEFVRANEIYVFSDKSHVRRLEINNEDFRRQILKRKKTLHFDYGSNVSSKILVFLLIVGGLAFLFWKSSPLISRLIAERIPVDVELKLRPYVKDQLVGEICNNPKANNSLKKIIDFLQKNDAHPYPAEISMGAQKIVNAFAFPGGQIIVEQGLVSKAKNQEALVGVIAHELQHLKQRHIVTAVIRGSLLTVMWRASFGDFTSIFTIDPTTLYQVASLKFTREHEAEADLRGAELMAKQGVAVMPLIDFLEHDIPTINSHLEFLSTHPLENRGEPLRKLYGNLKTTRLPLDQREWKELKSAQCGKK